MPDGPPLPEGSKNRPVWALPKEVVREGSVYTICSRGGNSQDGLVRDRACENNSAVEDGGVISYDNA